jgi:hypothetical protein
VAVGSVVRVKVGVSVGGRMVFVGMGIASVAQAESITESVRTTAKGLFIIFSMRYRKQKEAVYYYL